MFGKKLLIFLTLLLAYHIVRGWLFFFGPPPELILVDWLFGQQGKTVAAYNAVMEKPKAFATAIAGVLAGTLGTAIVPFAGIVQAVEISEHPPTGDFACGPDNNPFAKDMAALAVTVTPGCPSKRDAMHECCVEHDKCYTVLGVTQDECDETFCKCMKIATEGSGCAATADSFCYLVKDHGKASYDEAQEKTKAEMEATTATTATLDKSLTRDPKRPSLSWHGLKRACPDSEDEFYSCCFDKYVGFEVLGNI
ncbi:hypothetical protein GPALN_003773 [Globodera pallida]|nr:hypothetical protein GPALN_003773 [Globodera pallida]